MSTQEASHQERVRKAYGDIARTRKTTTSCCGNDSGDPHYSADEIASVPDGAFLGEGSGNPVRAANLQPGETVIDLGSGAGMDAFLAARAVGPTGCVTGYDMTPEMLARARKLQEGSGIDNVTFVESDIADLPAESEGADAVLSNCVINLSPDKAAVYREIFRVLRPGGRFSVADMILRGDAQRVYDNADKMTGCSCIAGAAEERRYLDTIRSAGFVDVQVVAERGASSPAQQRGFDEVAGLDRDAPQVEVLAVTVVGTRPEH